MFLNEKLYVTCIFSWSQSVVGGVYIILPLFGSLILGSKQSSTSLVCFNPERKKNDAVAKIKIGIFLKFVVFRSGCVSIENRATQSGGSRSSFSGPHYSNKGPSRKKNNASYQN